MMILLRCQYKWFSASSLLDGFTLEDSSSPWDTQSSKSKPSICWNGDEMWWNLMKCDEMWWNVMKSVVTSCYQLLYTVWKRLSAQLGLMDLSAASEWVSYHELSLCSPLPLVLMFFKLEKKKQKKRNHMENQKAKLQNRKKQLLHLVGYLRMKI